MTRHFKHRVSRAFLASQSGATAIEYALIAAFMAIILVGAVAALKPGLEQAFATVGEGLTAGP